jgi:hypothetical protein
MPTPAAGERPAQPYVAIRAQVTTQTNDILPQPLHRRLPAQFAK